MHYSNQFKLLIQYISHNFQNNTAPIMSGEREGGVLWAMSVNMCLPARPYSRPGLAFFAGVFIVVRKADRKTAAKEAR